MKRSLKKQLRRERDAGRAKWRAFLATNPKTTEDGLVSWSDWMKFCIPADAIYSAVMHDSPFIAAIKRDSSWGADPGVDDEDLVRKWAP